MRSVHTFAAFSVIGLAILAGGNFCRADIVSASVSESVSAFASGGTVLPGQQGGGDVSKSASNTTLPPIPLSVTATAALGTASSTITIDTYVGPATATDTAQSLDLVAELTGTAGVAASSGASISYTFALTAAGPYSLQRNTGTTLTGPSGNVPTGTGQLQAGTYILSVGFSANGPASSDDTFSLSVQSTPEPATLAFIGIALITCAGRRRKTAGM